MYNMLLVNAKGNNLLQRKKIERIGREHCNFNEAPGKNVTKKDYIE